MRRAPTGSCRWAGSRSGADGRHLGEALDGGRGLDRGRAAAATSGPPTRRDLHQRARSARWRLVGVPSAMKTEPRGTASRRRTGAAHARAVRADLDAVALADAEPLGVARARARRPAAGAGTAAPARRRPPWSSTASGRCRAAARPCGRGARAPRGDLQRRPAPTAGTSKRAADSRSGQRTPRPPISSSVRPGVERDGLEQLARGDRPGGDAAGRARRAPRRRR